MSKPSTYIVRHRASGACIYLRAFNLVVAEFVPNTLDAQETIGRLLDNHAMAVKNAEAKVESKRAGLDYLCCFGGGIGPDVWDKEIVIYATDFDDAAKQAKGVAEEAGGVVFSISQEG